MLLNDEILYDWSIDKMVEVKLSQPDDFLKIKETLTRIGIASSKEKKLTQSVHLLHKRGKYYLIHFKEIFCLEGKSSSITLEDVARRNMIISLIADWNLCTVVDPTKIANKATMAGIKVVPYKDKALWELQSKYQLGKKTTK